MTKPIFPWMGGKRRLAKEILLLFPPHTCYVEPFCGGAALFFMKEPSKVEVINDINGDITNLFRVVKHHLEALVQEFKWAIVSRQMFEWEQLKAPETLTDIQRAARFYYLTKNRFGAKPLEKTFGVTVTSPPRFNLLSLESDLSAAHLRLARTQIENLPWTECVTRYDRPATLFYFDPPYWKTEGYGVPFGLADYEALAEAMRTMKGKAILSINDHPDMRKVFKGFKINTVNTKYTVAQSGKGREKPRGEMVIRIR